MYTSDTTSLVTEPDVTMKATTGFEVVSMMLSTSAVTVCPLLKSKQLSLSTTLLQKPQLLESMMSLLDRLSMLLLPSRTVMRSTIN